jgi:hypothetical protein
MLIEVLNFTLWPLWQSDLVQPGMLIVSDIDEVFSPFRQGLFVDPQASRSVLIQTVLELTHSLHPLGPLSSDF